MHEFVSLRDRVICVDPWVIRSVHPPNEPAARDMIVHSMDRHGWMGRPLVVMPLRGKHGRVLYKALTGSHRHAASMIARLETIPVIPLTTEESRIALNTKGSWSSVMDSKGRVFDIMDRLHRAGYYDIAGLLEAEPMVEGYEIATHDPPWAREALSWYRRNPLAPKVSQRHEVLEVLGIEKWLC